LPAELPDNFTFNKVREILEGLETVEEDRLSEALAAALRLRIKGPLAILIFLKHHLAGAHEVEIDRLEEGESGAQYGVLIYPEGELPISVEFLPTHADAGAAVHYDPSQEQYR
jgi:hypothetical protein